MLCAASTMLQTAVMCKSCPRQLLELSLTPFNCGMALAGQMTFATDKLLASKGVDRARADAPWSQTELLVCARGVPSIISPLAN